MSRFKYQVVYAVLNWIDATTNLLTLGYAGTDFSTDYVFKQAKRKCLKNIEEGNT